MCARWSESFENFLEDMGPRPSRNHSIGRIDNDGDYTPENCRWETPSEQGMNTSRTRQLTWEGETRFLRDWDQVMGFRRGTISGRLYRGWSVVDALTLPVGTHRGTTPFRNGQAKKREEKQEKIIQKREEKLRKKAEELRRNIVSRVTKDCWCVGCREVYFDLV